MRVCVCVRGGKPGKEAVDVLDATFPAGLRRIRGYVRPTCGPPGCPVEFSLSFESPRWSGPTKESGVAIITNK